MTGELEVHHSPQLRFLLCTHYLFTHILIGNAVGIGTGLCLAASSSLSVIQSPPFRSTITLSYMITIVKRFGYLSKSLGVELWNH